MSNILLIAEQALVRAAMKRLLEDAGGIEVVAEAETGRGGMKKLHHGGANMVIMDTGSEGPGIFDIVRRMLAMHGRLKIIVIMTTMDTSLPMRMLKLGVRACLSRHCSANELYAAIRAVETGKHYVSSKVAEQMLVVDSQQGHSPFLKLSNRELQIMSMFIRAMTVHDISLRLCLSPKTISTYRYRIFSKLGVRGDVEMTHLAIRYGLLEAEPVIEEKWAS